MWYTIDLIIDISMRDMWLYIFSKNVRIIQLYNGDRRQTSESKEKDYFGSVSIYKFDLRWKRIIKLRIV